MQRWLVRVVVAGIVGGAALACACVSPADQFDDYLDRTNGIRGGGGSDAGLVIEASLPDGGFSGLYAMYCLPQLTTDPNKAFRFAVTVGFVPSASGGGTLTTSFLPIDKTATTAAQTVGAPIVPLAPTPVDAQAHFDIDVGGITLPAQADALVSTDAVFDTLHFIGVLTNETAFCGGLDGHIASPLPATLTADKNPCLFRPLADVNAPLPFLPGSAYHCP
jgi:hypothetical protein